MKIDRSNHQFSHQERTHQNKKGNIMYTALSFLFICALFYTVNLQIYQASRRNLLNIEQGYQAQILAVLASEYHKQQLAAEPAQQPQSQIESAPEQQTSTSSAAAAADMDNPDQQSETTNNLSDATMAATSSSLTTEPNASQSTFSEAATSVTFTFNTGQVTIDTSQVPHQVVVQLTGEQTVYKFDY